MFTKQQQQPEKGATDPKAVACIVIAGGVLTSLTTFTDYHIYALTLLTREGPSLLTLITAQRPRQMST